MNKEKEHFFDKPGNFKKFLGGFYISLILLIVIDFFVHKHPYFAWDGYPSFYAAFGFVACVGLVLGAKYILRIIVKRREDYYD